MSFRAILQRCSLLGVLVACAAEARFDPPAGSYSEQTARIEDQGPDYIVARVDSSFFTYAVNPLLGRAIMPAEYAQRARVALLSHAFWSARFKRDPAIIGRPLKVNDVSYTVVGIMPEGVNVPDGVAAWLPRD